MIGFVSNSCTERVDSVSIIGSNSQLNNSPVAQYVPDFNVRALTDLQYVKVTRSQYQTGLLASKLDSMPQSPESSHIRLDPGPLPPLTPPMSSTVNHTTAPPAPRENGPDETTSLLNDKNSLSKRRPSHIHPQNQPHLNTNSNSSPAPHPHGNSSPTPLPNPHAHHMHTFTHAHTESTI
ncbi:metal transporter CNNM4-like [Sinocyclocheilus anshuiensis]|uniref:metal transporter CNNM4-like n=1 Tax=Sinocyclocheilus anshuiensis TaxID=1608454 RepID=UPI0007B9C90D|nr:PREDICTED: metal transporter CNNM4-like [Sinocyclocheilus anshuiensis]